MSEGVPTIISHPGIYQLVVLEYVQTLRATGKMSSGLTFLLEIKSVCFALGYTCLCAVDKNEEMIGYFRVPEDQREALRAGVVSKDVEIYKKFIRSTVELMIDQGSKYHTMCAKLPPGEAEKPELIEELKARFRAKHVFRGPRLPDGRVRMIFQVVATETAEELVDRLKPLKEEK